MSLCSKQPQFQSFFRSVCSFNYKKDSAIWALSFFGGEWRFAPQLSAALNLTGGGAAPPPKPSPKVEERGKCFPEREYNKEDDLAWIDELEVLDAIMDDSV